MTDPVRCAGAFVFDEGGRLLLVRRGHAPAQGLWSEPSGRCEVGETDEQACVREAREETGLHVRPVRRAGSVSFDTADGTRYLITGFVCEVQGGALAAGDDAAEVRWVDRAEFARLPLVADLEDTVRSWGCLPRC